MTLLQRAAAVLPWLLAFTAIYIPARMLTLKRPSRLSREAALCLLWATAVAILSSTLSSDGTVTGFVVSPQFARAVGYYNYFPGRIFKRLIATEGAAFWDFLLVNIVGNVAIFIPFGFAVRLVSGRGIIFSTAAGAALSLFVEICQIPMPRYTDVDDLLLNTAGALIGALICLPRFIQATAPVSAPAEAAQTDSVDPERPVSVPAEEADEKSNPEEGRDE